MLGHDLVDAAFERLAAVVVAQFGDQPVAVGIGNEDLAGVVDSVVVLVDELVDGAERIAERVLALNDQQGNFAQDDIDQEEKGLIRRFWDWTGLDTD